MTDKITKIDAATCKRLRPLLNTHLATLGARLGLNIEATNATYDPAGEVTFKVRIELEGFDRDQHEFEMNCWAIPGLEPQHYGAEFYYGASRAAGGKEKWRLVGIKPRSPKWPILAEKLVGQGAGKRFKLPAAAVQAILREWEAA